MKSYRFVALFALSALAALACNKSEDKGSPTSREPGAATTSSTSTAKVDLGKAQVIFNERCAACHGATGKGDGPASGALNPKPRNYGDSAWQASVTDEQISKTILLGGAAVGKSPIMPASPDLDEKPEVVAGLVQIVRKFAH